MLRFRNAIVLVNCHSAGLVDFLKTLSCITIYCEVKQTKTMTTYNYVIKKG